ncbi:predicted protein [Histoplasma capsulatum var. duboisii H88]|uniref:Predicted protein n=1 Tax=Ajellomyces capsulatus (strain H88) TaxID=544711 RepID=F0U5B3_AJEC8|nr:predicted protein [Histoplasma capsulatum var. duboisii H88]
MNSLRRSQRSCRRNAHLQPGPTNPSSPPASRTLRNTVNDRKRKRECGLTRPGGFAVGEAKRTTSIDIDAPRVVQIVGPEILRSPTVSPQHRSSEPIRGARRTRASIISSFEVAASHSSTRLKV